MIALLDINVLIALFDAAHIHHRKAHEWLARNRGHGWATCPLTENGCVRILSQANYPGSLPVADIARRLRNATTADDHLFWSDDLSLCDHARFDHSLILSPKYLTDLYLLALSMARGGCLVTFDQGIPLGAVRGAGEEHLMMLS